MREWEERATDKDGGEYENEEGERQEKGIDGWIEGKEVWKDGKNRWLKEGGKEWRGKMMNTEGRGDKRKKRML